MVKFVSEVSQPEPKNNAARKTDCEGCDTLQLYQIDWPKTVDSHMEIVKGGILKKSVENGFGCIWLVGMDAGAP